MRPKSSSLHTEHVLEAFQQKPDVFGGKLQGCFGRPLIIKSWNGWVFYRGISPITNSGIRVIKYEIE
jgi:hypothetical protein